MCVAETEKCTRTQIVLTVIQRSDVYAELPWKAFALGASVGGLILLLLYSQFYDWNPNVPALMIVAGILACGALLALLAIMIPRFAKFFYPAIVLKLKCSSMQNHCFWIGRFLLPQKGQVFCFWSVYMSVGLLFCLTKDWMSVCQQRM